MGLIFITSEKGTLSLPSTVCDAGNGPQTVVLLVAVRGTWSRDGCNELRSGSPAVGGKAGPPLTLATGDVVELFAASASTMFSSGVPAFNVELEGDSSHLQLSRAQLGHRVGQVPSSVHSTESSPPGDASLTWRPVEASCMDGALQYGSDGRRPRPYGRGRWRFDSSLGRPSGPPLDGRLQHRVRFSLSNQRPAATHTPCPRTECLVCVSRSGRRRCCRVRQHRGHVWAVLLTARSAQGGRTAAFSTSPVSPWDGHVRVGP